MSARAPTNRTGYLNALFGLFAMVDLEKRRAFMSREEASIFGRLGPLDRGAPAEKFLDFHTSAFRFDFKALYLFEEHVPVLLDESLKSIRMILTKHEDRMSVALLKPAEVIDALDHL